MSDTVRLVLTGAVLPGHTRESLLHNLGGLLKLERERVATLLDDAPTVIKQQLPLEHLGAYLPLLERTGAVVRVEHPDGRLYQPRHAAAPDAFPTLLDDLPPVASPTPQVAPAPMQPVVAVVPTVEVIGPAEAPLALAEAEEETMNCPGCGHAQRKRTLCIACGVDMPRLAAAQVQTKREARDEIQAARGEIVRPLSGRAEPGVDCYETPALFGLSPVGRLGRMRYLAYSLGLILALIPGVLVFSIALVFLQGFWVVFAMAWAWMYIRLIVFRLHDINLSGWWVAAGVGLPSLVSLIDLRFGALASALVTVASLGLSFLPGNDGENQFGAPAAPPTMLINIVAIVSLALTLLSLPWVLQSHAVRGEDKSLDDDQMVEVI
ncbi:DUF805 domain-containing protein [Chitiniphilus eburneus]|uniref:DUF805 domain-containing protein n=1 Tax=Chitiniphilus eburneus TaxID=2571148 RepID=A0A4U0QCF9_9NEIS|nr:DUF805 domain-containing protein [Chitiniphilus eburneus]TJZ79103.1 DUF805 domain-containing protein [Chitiniphilus eburneus]